MTFPTFPASLGQTLSRNRPASGLAAVGAALFADPRVRLAAGLGLGLVLLVQMVRIGLEIAAPLPAPMAEPAAKPASDASILQRFDAFFPEGAQPTEADAGPGLKLFGLTTGGPGVGSAILGLADGTQVSVGVGETTPDGAVLTSVDFESALMTVSGARHRITFQNTETGVAEPVGASTTPLAENLPARRATGPAPEDRPKPPVIGGAASRQGPSAGANVGALIGGASLRPALRGLRMEGLTVGEGSKGLTAAGLQQGDVILSVNGQALNSPAAVTGLARSLGSARSVQVRYRRGDRVDVLTLGGPR